MTRGNKERPTDFQHVMDEEFEDFLAEQDQVSKDPSHSETRDAILRALKSLENKTKEYIETIKEHTETIKENKETTRENTEMLRKIYQRMDDQVYAYRSDT
ncbi:hypothetical protein CDD83_3075 [Cordyceps sp. RAO-2017]|nr:hypothetical protein CDD83_3075 [Cordyceps sp. RAO-2017]